MKKVMLVFGTRPEDVYKRQVLTPSTGSTRESNSSTYTPGDKYSAIVFSLLNIYMFLLFPPGYQDFISSKY